MEAAALLEQFFPDAGGNVEQFVALSGNRGLRWIVPSKRKKIAGLLSSWRPYTLKSRVSWDVIGVAVRGGFLGRLPGAECFSVDISATNWQEYGWTGEKQPLVLAYVGTQGEHQKLVVTLADPESGEGKRVIKFPLADTAWSKITHEYETLQVLRDEGRNNAPSPVKVNHEKHFSVQDYMLGRAVGVALGEAHYAFLASLSQREHRIDLEVVRAQVAEHHRLLSEAGGMTSELAVQMGELLGKTIWNGTIQAVRLHGDFAPWNLKRQSDGMLCAVDWEDSQIVGLPFYDLYFYKTQVGRLLGRDIKVDRRAYVNALFNVGYEGNDKMLAAIERVVNMMAVIYFRLL